MNRYTAILYFNNEELLLNSGDNLEALYIWMLTQSEGFKSTIYGKIIDNEDNHKIVREFRKSFGCE